MRRTISESSVGKWIGIGGALVALTAVAFFHERREDARFLELTKRIEELRVLVREPTSTPECRPVERLVGGDVLADTVAERVVARIGRVAPPDPSRGARSEPAEEPAPRTPEQRQLVARAGEIVERALRGRELRREDVIELRSIFARTGPAPERGQLQGQIVNAINDQRLVVEDPTFIVF
jgi:hypothetical protein